MDADSFGDSDPCADDRAISEVPSYKTLAASDVYFEFAQYRDSQEDSSPRRLI